MYILVRVAFIEIFNVLEIKDICTEILVSRLVSVIILCSSALKYFFVESFLSYRVFLFVAWSALSSLTPV